MKITKLTYNFYQTGDLNVGLDEYYSTAEVGKKHDWEKKTVKEIIENKPIIDGDKLSYDIVFEDNSMLRIYYPHTVNFSNQN